LIDRPEFDETNMHQVRLPALDSLRAISILMVIYSHSIQVLHGTFLPGQYGVTVFFFISGFIITRLLLAQEKIDLQAFYIRRWFRLAPALMVYMVVSVIALACIGYSIPIADLVSVFFYSANYHYVFSHFATFGSRSVGSPFTICWSLAVEEHFYLLFPLLIILLRRKVGRIAGVLTLFCCVVLAWRVYLTFGAGHLLPYRIEMGTDTRLDSIAFGCLLSALFHLAAHGNRRISEMLDVLSGYRGVVVCGLLILASTITRNPDFKYTFSYSLQGAALAALFIGLFWKNPAAHLKSALEHEGLVFVGAISYSLYLYHYLGFVIGQLVLNQPMLQFLFTWTFGVAGALMSYYWVENRGRAAGRRYESSPMSVPTG
jgi:peptidoglycan/LPS O-acetylase OafA/YrhL